MKKRLGIILLIVGVLVLSMLAGCGGEDDGTDFTGSGEIHESDESFTHRETDRTTEAPSGDAESMWGELPPVPLL